MKLIEDDIAYKKPSNMFFSIIYATFISFEVLEKQRLKLENSQQRRMLQSNTLSVFTVSYGWEINLTQASTACI